MATIIKKSIFSLCLLITTTSILAHTIYAPSDIQLLDNRVRIDPLTEQVTFILNHSKGAQLVVLVRPDGSKIYRENHPDTVAWVATRNVDIITIDEPMVGPWQAIASLDGNNRIRLLSPVHLKTSKLPLKLYEGEYITTHASLYQNDKLMKDNSYLSQARLTVSLIGSKGKVLSLYKDDGKNYDSLPFDGDLTAHLHIDIKPGRYLLSIRTQNDVFIRNQNKDAVVFRSPIKYSIKPVEYGSKKAEFSFQIDTEELKIESVTIDALIKDDYNKVVAQVLAHGKDNTTDKVYFNKIEEIGNGAFTFSGKAFATTTSGREIELALADKRFWLRKKAVAPVIVKDKLKPKVEQAVSESLWSSLWIIIAIAGILLVLMYGASLIFVRVRKRKLEEEGGDTESISELSLSGEDLVPMASDEDQGKDKDKEI